MQTEQRRVHGDPWRRHVRAFMNPKGKSYPGHEFKLKPNVGDIFVRSFPTFELIFFSRDSLLLDIMSVLHQAIQRDRHDGTNMWSRLSPRIQECWTLSSVAWPRKAATW